jgi:hypothetical protein
MSSDLLASLARQLLGAGQEKEKAREEIAQVLQPPQQQEQEQAPSQAPQPQPQPQQPIAAPPGAEGAPPQPEGPPVVDMSQIPEEQPGGPPDGPAGEQPPAVPPSGQPPFAEPDLPPVPVTNTQGVKYTVQSQDERARNNAQWGNVQNLTQEGMQQEVDAENQRAVLAEQKAHLEQPVLDHQATLAHQEQTAEQQATEIQQQKEQELRTRYEEVMQRRRAAIGEDPKSAWDSGDNRARAMGIIGVILSAPASAPQLMSSLNHLLFVDASAKAAYDARLTEYEKSVGKASEFEDKVVTNHKARVEMNMSLAKTSLEAEVAAIANRMAPGEARAKALSLAGKFGMDAAKQMGAGLDMQAKANNENEAQNIHRDQAYTDRLNAIAAQQKAAHGDDDKYLKSSEAEVTDGSPGFAKDLLTEKPREKIVAAQEVIGGLDNISKMLDGSVSGFRKAQVELRGLVPAIGTASGLSRHDPHSLELLSSQVGLNLSEGALNKLSGVQTRYLINRLQRRMAETIELNYKQANPSAKLSEGGMAYRIRENARKEEVVLKEVTDIVKNKQTGKAQKIAALSLLKKDGNPFAAEALRELK